MIPLKIGQVRLKFFDSRLLAKADKARWGFLTYAGGFIRKTSRNLIKAGKPGIVSQPGKPPLYHRSSPVRYKDTIFYFVEKSESKVYVGAILLGGKGGHKIPKILEYGGVTTVIVGTGRFRRQVSVTIKARPHMRPAMKTFIEKKQAALLKNSIVAR